MIVVNLLFLLALIGVLGYLSYYDIKTHTIKNKHILGLMGGGILFMVLNHFFGSVPVDTKGNLIVIGAVFLLFLIIYFIYPKGFGAGDTKLITALGFYVRFYMTHVMTIFLLIWVFSVISAVIFKLILRKEEKGIPLAPAISLSFLLIVGWEFYVTI